MTEIIRAFLVGGAICAVGQLLIDFTKLTPARILTGYVVAGVVLSALGLYRPLADFAGAGASVPLTGFGHALAEGMIPVVKGEIPLKAHAHRCDDILTAIRIAREFGVGLTLDPCTDGIEIAEAMSELTAAAGGIAAALLAGLAASLVFRQRDKV